MRIKIGDVWYDAQDQAICIQVDEAERKQIFNMDPLSHGKYAQFPSSDNRTVEEKREWMKG